MTTQSDILPLLALICVVLITYRYNNDRIESVNEAMKQQNKELLRHRQRQRPPAEVLKANATVILTEYEDIRRSSSSSSSSSSETILKDVGVPLPPFFDNLADLVPLDSLPSSTTSSSTADATGGGGGGKSSPTDDNPDIPFFWHISRGGGNTIRDIFGRCLDLVQASHMGARDATTTTAEGDDESSSSSSSAALEDLRIIRLDGAKYVNVDVTTPDGIAVAKELNAVKSGLIDVVVSHRFIATTTLFVGGAAPAVTTSSSFKSKGSSSVHHHFRGRFFAFFRHPVERAISLFYYLGYVKWDTTFVMESVVDEIQKLAREGKIENNWMVRSLVDKMGGFLTFDDLELAKEILRRKCLVGLLKEKEESLKRFEAYFGWTERAKQPGVWECEEKYLEWAWSNKHRHPTFEEGTEVYDLLKSKNELDLELYKYALVLFEQQGVALGFRSSR